MDLSLTESELAQAGARRPGRPWLAALAALAAMALAGAALLAWMLPAEPPAELTLAAGQVSASDVRELAELPLVAARLRARLATAPADGEGWALLARTYARLGEHANAGLAFDKAVALQAGDAALLVDYADTLAFLNNRSFDGQPAAMIERALAIEPDNAGALMLAGLAAFDRQDWAKAEGYWQHVAAIAGDASPLAGQARAGIAEARRRAAR